MIRRNGTPSRVMVSVDERNRKSTRQGSPARFLLRSPLPGLGLDDARLDDSPRDLTLVTRNTGDFQNLGLDLPDFCSLPDEGASGANNATTPRRRRSA